MCNTQRRRVKRKHDQSTTIGIDNEEQFFALGQPRELDNLELDSGLRQLIQSMNYQRVDELILPAPLHALLFVNRFVEKVCIQNTDEC